MLWTLLSEKWTIKMNVKLGNTAFEQMTWFQVLWLMHSHTTAFSTSQELNQPSYFNFLLSRVTFGRELCVLSPSTYKATQLPSPKCPCLPQLVWTELGRLVWKKQRHLQAPHGLVGSDLQGKERCCSVFVYCEDSLHSSLQGWYTLHLSQTGLSREGGWDRMFVVILLSVTSHSSTSNRVLSKILSSNSRTKSSLSSSSFLPSRGWALSGHFWWYFVLCSCTVSPVEGSHPFY